MTAEQQTAAEDAPKLRIRGAKDIFDALASSDFGMRLSIARAIAADPEKASSYGTYNGMEIVDYLLQLLRRSSDSSYRPVLLAALAAFGDPRIPDLFMTEMAESEDPEPVMAAAARLAREKGEKVRRFMAMMLRRDAATTQARMAANIMAAYGDLRPEERVRIAVTADIPFAAPPLDDMTEQAWLAELAGDAAGRARILLEEFGQDAFLKLRGKWSALDENSRTWLLQWGAREHQLYSIELLADAINTGSPALLLEALAAIPALGRSAALFRPALARFAAHDDRAVRIAAIRAGAPLTGIKDRIPSEKDKDLLLALIARLPEEEGSLQALLGLLADDQWEVRAAATRALLDMGEQAASAVRPLLAHPSANVRASAAQVLAASNADALFDQPAKDQENRVNSAMRRKDE